MKRSSKLGLGLVALLLFQPSLAPGQPQATPCEVVAKGLLAERTTARTTTEKTNDGCAFSHLRFDMGPYRGWTIDRLALGPRPEALAKDKPIPKALLIEARGVRFAPDLKDARSRYMVAMRQRPFDARLRYDLDEAGRQLRLHELAVDSAHGGLISVALDADLKDGEGSAARFDPNELGVRRVRIVLDNNGLFEEMLAPALIGLMPPDADPAVEIPKAKAREIERLGKLPSSVIDEDSRQALIRFVGDFPHPMGRFEVEQTLDRPLRLSDLKSGGPGAWLSGSRLKARYETSASRYPPTAR